MSDQYTAFSKIFIASNGPDEVAFGRGLISLLRAIDQAGSLNRACKVVGISYSKAWKRLRKVEEQMSVTLVEKNGSHGSALTAEGKSLVDMYDKLNASVNQFAVSEFKRLKSSCSAFAE